MITTADYHQFLAQIFDMKEIADDVLLNSDGKLLALAALMRVFTFSPIDWKPDQNPVLTKADIEKATFIVGCLPHFGIALVESGTGLPKLSSNRRFSVS